MAEDNDDILISFRNADILGGDRPVLYDVNFDVHKGDFVYIVGKVGSGKTSLIRAIIAETPLHRGRLTVCRMQLDRIKDRQIAPLRRRLGIVFQDFQLLMDRSVQDNLEFVLRCTGWKDGKLIAERTNKVLCDVGMETKAHKMPYQLSGGEQQRIAIARALLNDPCVILADEPTGNLDHDTADGLMQLLTKINRECGTAVVMVTHNTTFFDAYPGRILVCDKEKCTEKE